MSEPKRWQKDGLFVDWLISMAYASLDAKGRPQATVSEGLAIYMWEAWKAGRAQG